MICGDADTVFSDGFSFYFADGMLTWFPTSPHTLLVRVEAVLVPAAASVPETCAALARCVVVPLQHKFGTRAFFFGELANVHS